VSLTNVNEPDDSAWIVNAIDDCASASTFSTAFSRPVGQPPSRYARALV
jgi:hypothetical protein